MYLVILPLSIMGNRLWLTHMNSTFTRLHTDLVPSVLSQSLPKFVFANKHFNFLGAE
jgi:hypothetical protein